MNVIGHGIDLVEIGRIARMLDEHGAHFTERCFTETERAHAEGGRAQRTERFAARFACKEAVLKALGTGMSRGVSWLDMQIDTEPSGRPVLALTGRAAEIAHELGIDSWHISMSHTGGFAIASAIACAASGR